MKKGEKVLLTVKPQCNFFPLFSIEPTLYIHSSHYIVCLFHSDGFGEKGKPASANEGGVLPNAILQITLELVSWKTVSEVTDDKKVVKKILKESEGYDRPNDGSVVKC